MNVESKAHREACHKATPITPTIIMLMKYPPFNLIPQDDDEMKAKDQRHVPNVSY